MEARAPLKAAGATEGSQAGRGSNGRAGRWLGGYQEARRAWHAGRFPRCHQEASDLKAKVTTGRARGQATGMQERKECRREAEATGPANRRHSCMI